MHYNISVLIPCALKKVGCIAKLIYLQSQVLILFLCYVCPSSLYAYTDVAAGNESQRIETILFASGEEGYHSFRIPALILAKNGDLLAFCEARVRSHRDYGDIDLVMKRSKDDGRTWSSIERIIHLGFGTWGNPTLVLDEEHSRIFLFYSSNSEVLNQFGDKPDDPNDDGFIRIKNWGERRLHLTYSDDHGKNWSNPRDLTDELVPRNYAWDAVGPGVGIQQKVGDRRGRLVVPALHRNIVSDDYGVTWRVEPLPSGTSEAAIVERVDGLLCRNDRATGAKNKSYRRRMVSKERSAGQWDSFAPHHHLPDPICQGSILRYTSNPSRIIFLNPGDVNRRRNMTLRMSYDEGESWVVSRSLVNTKQLPNHGGYSSLTKTDDKQIGILYELNDSIDQKESGRSIYFIKVNLGWLLDQK